MNVHPEYIVDENSNKKSVVILFPNGKKLLRKSRSWKIFALMIAPNKR